MINLFLFSCGCFICLFSYISQPGDASTANFDPQFLRLPLKLTPPDWDILDSQKTDEFASFNYVNPNYIRDVAASEFCTHAEQQLRTLQNAAVQEDECPLPPTPMTESDKVALRTDVIGKTEAITVTSVWLLMLLDNNNEEANKSSMFVVSFVVCHTMYYLFATLYIVLWVCIYFILICFVIVINFPIIPRLGMKNYYTSTAIDKDCHIIELHILNSAHFVSLYSFLAFLCEIFLYLLTFIPMRVAL